MVEKTIYANGQKVYELKGEVLTYYFKSGALKAQGKFLKNKKEGEWRYYRKNGDLWRIGNYLAGKKHGRWQRYSPEGQVEYDAVFENGTLIKE